MPSWNSLKINAYNILLLSYVFLLSGYMRKGAILSKDNSLTETLLKFSHLYTICTFIFFLNTIIFYLDNDDCKGSNTIDNL